MFPLMKNSTITASWMDSFVVFRLCTYNTRKKPQCDRNLSVLKIKPACCGWNWCFLYVFVFSPHFKVCLFATMQHLRICVVSVDDVYSEKLVTKSKQKDKGSGFIHLISICENKWYASFSYRLGAFVGCVHTHQITFTTIPTKRTKTHTPDQFNMRA